MPGDFGSFLDAVLDTPLQGTFLESFRLSVARLLSEAEEVFESESKEPKKLFRQFDDAGGQVRIYYGFGVALRKAIYTFIYSVIPPDSFEIDSLGNVLPRLKLSDDESKMLMSSFQAVNHPNEDEKLEEEVIGEINYALNFVSDLFYIQLANQYGKLNPYLFERLITDYRIYINNGIEFDIETRTTYGATNYSNERAYAYGTSDADTQGILKNSFLTRAQKCLISYSTYTENNDPISEYEAACARIRLIYLKANIMLEKGSFIAAFNESFAELTGFELEGFDSKKLDGYICRDDFNSTEFVDRVESKFLKKLPERLKLDYRESMEDVMREAATSTGTKVPPRYVSKIRS